MNMYKYMMFVSLTAMVSLFGCGEASPEAPAAGTEPVPTASAVTTAVEATEPVVATESVTTVTTEAPVVVTTEPTQTVTTPVTTQ